MVCCEAYCGVQKNLNYGGFLGFVWFWIIVSLSLPVDFVRGMFLKLPAAWFFVGDLLVKLCFRYSFKQILRLVLDRKKCYVLCES